MLRLLLSLSLLIMMSTSCRSWSKRTENSATTGNNDDIATTCIYRAIPGQAEVISTSPLRQDDIDQVEIHFRFTPTQANPLLDGKKLWTLRYGDGELPCQEWADKNFIKTGQKTPVILEQLTEGDCEPFVFDYYPSVWDFEPWYEICQ
ncbi:MAG: hypothetical protein AB8C84_02200 [Oligoflexales bacterium]